MAKLKLSHSLDIRKARLGDLSEIEKIEKSSFSDPYPSNLIALLASTRAGEFLVAELDRKIIGYVSIIFDKPLAATVASIATHPLYRKKNVAKKLLTTIIENMKKRNFSTLRLEVRESNTSAINLYKSLGFKHVRTVKKYYDDGEAAAEMQLSLII